LFEVNYQSLAELECASAPRTLKKIMQSKIEARISLNSAGKMEHLTYRWKRKRDALVLGVAGCLNAD
jgi:hypothetical protein